MFLPIAAWAQLPIASGGTGASTASAALSNLGGVSKAGGTLTGAVSGPSFNNALNAAAYCATPYVLDQTCIQNAVAAATAGQSIFVPAGTYNGTSGQGTISMISQSNVSLVLDPNAYINYNLNFIGPGYYLTNKVDFGSNINAGSSSITGSSGEFSAYSAGNNVMIQQLGGGGANNQIGLEVLKVLSVTNGGATLNFASPTQFQYYTGAPNVIQINTITNVTQYTGTIPRGTMVITGTFNPVPAVGSLVRIENTTGIDAPLGCPTGGWVGCKYFEIARVAASTSTSIRFEEGLHATYGNPWLIDMNTISNVSIHGNGGQINETAFQYVNRSSLDGVYVSGSSDFLMDYDFKYTNVRGNAQGNQNNLIFSFDFDGVISNIVAYGAASPVDSSTVGGIGLQDVAISNVSSWGMQSLGGGGGAAYAFSLDFDYTPYYVWDDNDSVTNVVAGEQYAASPLNDYSMTLHGLRNSTLSAMTAMGGIDFNECSNISVAGLIARSDFYLDGGSNCSFTNFTVDSIYLSNNSSVTNSKFTHFHLTNNNALNGIPIQFGRGSTGNSFIDGLIDCPNSCPNPSIQIGDTTSSGNYFQHIKDASSNPNSVYGASGNVAEFFGENQFSGGLGFIVATPLNFTGGVKVSGGTNTVYICTSSGSLAVGALTITPASCGTSAATGLSIN